MDTTDAAAEPNASGPLQPFRRADRWMPVIPSVILLAAFFAVLFCGLPGVLSFILIPIFVLGSPVILFALVVWAISLAARKLFRRAASVLVATILPVILSQPISWSADFVHLGLTIGFGIGQLNDTLPQVDDRFQAHDWSVGLAGGPNTFLLYDKTDEIASPLVQHRGRVVPEDSIETVCAGNVRHLLGHYYVCTF